MDIDLKKSSIKEGDFSGAHEMSHRHPIWLTESGSARNCDFHPTFTLNANADEAALVRVMCEHDGRESLVGLTWSSSIQGVQKINRLSQGNLSPRSAYLEPEANEVGEAFVLMSLLELWIREDGVWLKLDDMARAAIPMIRKKARSPFKACSTDLPRVSPSGDA